MNLNHVFLWGRLTADPELKQTASGKFVTEVSIAVPQKQYSKEHSPKTDFINVQVWGNTAEFLCKWFSKGSAVLVVGRLATDNYTHKDGHKVYKTFVVATEISFGDSKQNSNTPAARGEEPHAAPAAGNGIGDMSGFEEVIGTDDGAPF